jgi:hypothetical protein
VYRALHDPPPENQGFLRDGARLAVFYFTDEDDCSATPDTDLFDPARTADYGINHSFRCTRFGVACSGGLVPDEASGGPLAGCHPASSAEGGKLIEVQKYIDFFTRPASEGGIKDDPREVVLATIAGPKEPVATLLTTPCADAIAPSCVVLAHGCHSPQPADAMGNPLLFADPAVRLETVVEAAEHHQFTSFCEEDWSNAFTSLGDLILAPRDASACLTAAIARTEAPNCDVTELVPNAAGTMTATMLPACASAAPPCWRVTPRADCPAPQSLELSIDHGATEPVVGARITARCAR